MKLYDLETKEYEMNVRYENKLIKIAKDAMNHMVPTTLTSDDSNTSIDMFDDAVGILTYDIIKNNERHVLNSEAKAFLRVRSLDLYMSRGRLAYRNILDRKSSVLHQLFQNIANPVQPRFFAVPPSSPCGYASTNTISDGENIVEVQNDSEYCNVSAMNTDE